MIKLGFTLSSEEFGPRDLVRFAIRAEASLQIFDCSTHFMSDFVVGLNSKHESLSERNTHRAAFGPTVVYRINLIQTFNVDRHDWNSKKRSHHSDTRAKGLQLSVRGSHALRKYERAISTLQ
jgi:hypothetical protein